LKDLVFGQAKINENLTKKLSYNDKIIENINSKLETLSSSVKNQLSFNKRIESQIAQIAAAILVNHSGKIPGQPENSFEFAHVAADQ
jgi:predicted RNase H-like nuclease (RuvC/YqgF family)